MDYKLFTFPNCSHCTDIKTYLSEKDIDYQEVNIGLRSGKKDPTWKHIYSRNLSGEAPLDQDDKGLVLPVLAKLDGQGDLEKISQGDQIKDLFE